MWEFYAVLTFSQDVSAKVSNVHVCVFVLPFLGLFCLAVEELADVSFDS